MASVVTISDLEARAPLGFRTLPHNIDAEQALLGAILVNNEAYHRVSGFLRAEHFYEPVHGRIFAASERLIESGRVADHVTLKARFDQDEALKDLDGAGYLARLARAAETILNAADYGRLLHDLALKRGLANVGEAITNAAYDAASPDTALDQLDRARKEFDALAGEVPASAPSACALASVDVEGAGVDEVIPPDRFLVESLMPVGTAGISAGPGGAGKSFLAMMRMVCLATGNPFMGFEVEACPVLGYFSEDNAPRLQRYLQKICRGMGIDAATLKGRLEIVSTVGHRRKLFVADRSSNEVVPQPWFYEVLERAKSIGARSIDFDHVGRLTSINRIDANQIFDMFMHLDGMASEIDGCVCMLAHPSKGDLRSGKKSGPDALVGGAIAMIDAPRWVHGLRWVKPDDGEKYRVFSNEKTNYAKRLAIKLVESDITGLVQRVEDLDPDDPAGNGGENSGDGTTKSRSKGRPSLADKTFNALREMFIVHRRAIALDEIVREGVRIGNLKEAIENSDGWHQRKRTVRAHLHVYRDMIDERENDTYALKPEALP